MGLCPQVFTHMQNADMGTVTMMGIKEILATNLNRLMAWHGYTSSKTLAAASGVGHGTIDRLQKAQADVRIETLDALAKVFKMELWQLLVPDLDVADMPHLAHPTGIGLDRVISTYKALDDEGRAVVDNAADASWTVFQIRSKARKYR